MHDSTPGLIRLSLDELLSTSFAHLQSGIDADVGSPKPNCGQLTTVSGYTEWVGGETGCMLSIGWDWYIQHDFSGFRWVRLGLPRTNVLLTDEFGNDRSWLKNLEQVATIVDAMPWSEIISSAMHKDLS